MHHVPAGGSVPGLCQAKGYSGGGIWREAGVVGLRLLPGPVSVLRLDSRHHNEAHAKATAE